MNYKNVGLLTWVTIIISACIPIPAATASPTLPDTPGPPPETSTPGTATPYSLTFPARKQWKGGSLAFSHGAEGDWDYILWGGFANSLIKKGNTYYLYYQGSSSYDQQCESVAYRAIGVATSTDGIHWVKSAKNPVIRWSTSQGSIEEGAVSSAAWLDADGRIYLYYGANTGSGCTVNASARLAISEDGENFQDLGEVLSGKDPGVWGFGDEIFPVGVYSSGEEWSLYYTPNGVALSRKLGVATGNSSSSFNQSMGANDGTIPSWGPVSAILEGHEALLITNPGTGDNSIDIYRLDAAHPSVLQHLDTYTIPNCLQPSFLYEPRSRRWMASCRDQNAENYYIIIAAP